MRQAVIRQATHVKHGFVKSSSPPVLGTVFSTPLQPVVQTDTESCGIQKCMVARYKPLQPAFRRGGGGGHRGHSEEKPALQGGNRGNERKEAGTDEAAAEPSTTKTYFATRHSGFKYISWERKSQKWRLQIKGVRVKQAFHASLDDAKRMVARYKPLQPSCKRRGGHRGIRRRSLPKR